MKYSKENSLMQNMNVPSNRNTIFEWSREGLSNSYSAADLGESNAIVISHFGKTAYVISDCQLNFFPKDLFLESPCVSFFWP